MKLLQYMIIAFSMILFGISAIAGTAIREVYYAEAKISQAETNSLLAMSLAQLSDVTVTQRVL